MVGSGRGAAVSEVHAFGLDVFLITGDNKRTAEASAREVEIRIDRVFAGVLRPIVAAAAMAASSVSVVSNSLLLRRRSLGP